MENIGWARELVKKGSVDTDCETLRRENELLEWLLEGRSADFRHAARLLRQQEAVLAVARRLVRTWRLERDLSAGLADLEAALQRVNQT